MMLFRAFLLCVLAVSCRSAYASQCSYEAENSFLSRVVAIDSSGGPVYRPAKDDAGASGERAPLELHEKEVVLIFDQGPHAAYTGYILDILDHHCAKAAFFFTGSAAVANADAARDVAHRGHTLAAGPWSVSSNLATLSNEDARAEIEKGFAAVAKVSDAPVAPFFRAGKAALPPATLAYLRERGVSLWYADIEPGDTGPGPTASQLANGTLLKIREPGKGIVLFHDTRKVTVDALDSILGGLKLSGFKVVQIVPAESLAPRDEYLTRLAPTANEVSSGSASRMLIAAAKRRVRPVGTDRAERRRTVLRRDDSRRVRPEDSDRAESRRIALRREEWEKRRARLSERQQVEKRRPVQRSAAQDR